MPQDIYFAAGLLVLLLLYLLYRLKLLNNDVRRLRRELKNVSGIPLAKAEEARAAQTELTDDSELVSVLTAAIMAFESSNGRGSSSDKSVPAHGFVIRRIVRIS